MFYFFIISIYIFNPPPTSGLAQVYGWDQIEHALYA